MMLNIFEGLRLACWGVGLLLVWLSMQRTVQEAHRRLANVGVLAPPSHAELPITAAHPQMLIAIAFICGTVPLFAFTPQIMGGFVRWLDGRWSPSTSALALQAQFMVEVYFLYRIAFRPAFKMRWAASWYLFSMIVGFVW